MKELIYSLFGISDSVKRRAFIESIKEVGRWAFSITAAIILTQLITSITFALTNNTVPTMQPIDFLGISFELPVRPFIEFVLLPLLIRFADKFKFVKEKEEIKRDLPVLDVDSDKPQPSGVVPF